MSHTLGAGPPVSALFAYSINLSVVSIRKSSNEIQWFHVAFPQFEDPE